MCKEVFLTLLSLLNHSLGLIISAVVRSRSLAFAKMEIVFDLDNVRYRTQTVPSVTILNLLLLHLFHFTHFHNQCTQLRGLCLLELLLQDFLECNGISGELGDTFTELLNRHLVLVEVEAEGCLVVNVRLLLNVEVLGISCIELLRDGIG